MLPDPKLTPGKVAVSRADARGVSEEMREAVFARYRVPFENRGAYVIDHLIPRELGGADALENLWPQRINARPYPARRKQLLAAELTKLIASGKMTLAQAQTEMQEDWISSFVTHIGMVYLSPDKVPAGD